MIPKHEWRRAAFCAAHRYCFFRLWLYGKSRWRWRQSPCTSVPFQGLESLEWRPCFGLEITWATTAGALVAKELGNWIGTLPRWRREDAYSWCWNRNLWRCVWWGKSSVEVKWRSNSNITRRFLCWLGSIRREVALPFRCLGNQAFLRHRGEGKSCYPLHVSYVYYGFRWNLEGGGKM